MNIFLLEDDETLGFGIKTYLENWGYKVCLARSLKDSKSKFSYRFDLVILDVNLPDGTGFDFLNIYNLNKTPVIFLTVNDGEEDIIRGLNLSDDYITKPFKLSILKARIESIFRRIHTKDKKLNYKSLVLDTENFEASLNSKPLNLTLKEFQLLNYLLINQGTTLTRDKILGEIWDLTGNFVEDNTLSATVKRLRKKLGNYSHLIETVRGVGYRFAGD